MTINLPTTGNLFLDLIAYSTAVIYIYAAKQYVDYYFEKKRY